MEREGKARFGLLSVLVLVSFFLCHQTLDAAGRDDFEVWVVDQSNTPGQTFGGTLYIYDGEDLSKNPAGAIPEIIDYSSDQPNIPAPTHVFSFTNVGPNIPTV